MLIKYEPKEDMIREYFPEGHEFSEIVIKPDIMPGDIVRIKENVPSGKVGRIGSKDYKSIFWKVDKVHVDIYDDGSYCTVISNLTEENPEFKYCGGWMEDVPSEFVDVITRTNEPYEQKLFLPYKIGEIVWNFPNHLYDVFTPYRLRIDKYVWYVGTSSVMFSYSEWTYDNTKKGYTNWDFHSRYGWGPYMFYSSVGKDKCVSYFSIPMVKDIFKDKNNLVYFANKTYNKDSFSKCDFGKPKYEQLMLDIGLTFDDLICASNTPLQTSSKKTVPKKKTSKTVLTKDKPSKVEEIFKGMTEKQKNEMLKLLQNSK